jgi:hypothetical protein
MLQAAAAPKAAAPKATAVVKEAKAAVAKTASKAKGKYCILHATIV